MEFVHNLFSMKKKIMLPPKFKQIHIQLYFPLHYSHTIQLHLVWEQTNQMFASSFTTKSPKTSKVPLPFPSPLNLPQLSTKNQAAPAATANLPSLSSTTPKTTALLPNSSSKTPTIPNKNKTKNDLQNNSTTLKKQYNTVQLLLVEESRF